MNATAARGTRLAPLSLFERVRMKLAHAAAHRQLSNLDDRMLRDIGMTRADIEIRRFLK